ncbi:unnamed protein product, partial [Rotaria magnacalcarata]
HEIFSWHLNYSNNYVKLRDNIDYLIDFEDLIDCYNSISLGNNNNNNNNDTKSFIIQPVTTLDAARKNIEMWKNLQENIIENTPNQSVDKRLKRKRTKTPSKIQDGIIDLYLYPLSLTFFSLVIEHLEKST